MRITGGALRGRQVEVPPGIIRPAMDRMRESLFSILGPLEGSTFLDLFSGSGIMALEAISRGADSAVSVERDAGKRSTIIRNLAIAKVPGEDAKRRKITLRIMPVERYIMRANGCFGVVFCDPPFAYKFKVELIDRILSARLLCAGPRSRLLIHHPSSEPLPETFGNVSEDGDGNDRYVRVDERLYGGSTVTFYGYS